LLLVSDDFEGTDLGTGSIRKICKWEKKERTGVGLGEY